MTGSLLIGLTGGTGSGKTTVCRQIIHTLKHQMRVQVLSLESFYKQLPAGAVVEDTNFDHPDAFDVDLLLDTLKTLKAGQSVELSEYNLATHTRQNPATVEAADVIVLEGILTLYWKEVRDLLDIKVFVDLDSDIRLSRRGWFEVKRSIQDGRDVRGGGRIFSDFGCWGVCGGGGPLRLGRVSHPAARSDAGRGARP